MVTPKMGANKITMPYEMPSERERLHPDVISLMQKLQSDHQRYPEQKRLSYLQQTSGKSKYVGKTVALFYTNTDEHYTLGSIIGMSYAGDLGNASVSFENNEEGANFFRDHLFVENNQQNWILVPHGAKRYMSLLRSTYVLNWMNDGYEVEVLPSSAGGGIIIVKMGKSSWTLLDYTQHTTRDPEDVGGYVDAILSPDSDPLLTATLLLDFVHYHEDDLMSHFGIHTSLTFAATGMQLGKKHWCADMKMWRPPAILSHWLRDKGSPLGGYIYAVPYRGGGYEVDQRRAYSTYMAGKIPFRWRMGFPYKDSQFREGIYLCTIDVRAHIPVYLRAYDANAMQFTNRHVLYGEHYAIIPSAEFEGLRKIGCTIKPHYGWVATAWFTMSPLIEAVEKVIDVVGEKSAFTKALKVMVNAIPGKFSSNHLMREVMLSVERPDDEWMICLDAFAEEIPHNWWREVENHKSYMNVAAAEWIYAAQRNAVYLYLAAEHAVGNRMVHWAVDGGLMVGTPHSDMPLQSNVRGTFVLKNSHCDIQVFGPNHNIVNGVTKHAGQAKYTTEQMRLVLVSAPRLVPEAAQPVVSSGKNPWALLVEGKHRRPVSVKENGPRDWHNMPTDVYFREICKLYGPKSVQPAGV